jgi:hypothetical protein
LTKAIETSKEVEAHAVRTGIDEHRTSLISELDPALRDCIDRYSQRYSSDSLRPSASLHKLPHANWSDPSRQIGSLTAAADHDDAESVHLFNMRISQRLASRSQIPMLSPTSSANQSLHSLVPKKVRAESTIPSDRTIRAPTHISREHNRRPSDPQTLRLFEANLVQRDASQSWKTVTSGFSEYESSNGHASHGIFPRHSGTHPQENGTSLGLAPDESVKKIRRTSQLNPHSLAVAGRAASVGASTASLQRFGRHLSPADSGWSRQRRSSDNPRSSEDSWLAPTHLLPRGRAGSTSRAIPHREHVSPTPAPRRTHDITKDDETMSAISLDHVLDRRNEHMTELSAQGVKVARDENMSEEVCILQTESKRSIDHEGCYMREPQKSTPPPVPVKPAHLQNSVPVFGIAESATDAWTRAFQKASQDSNRDHNNFLLTPRYDRDGRRRSFSRDSRALAIEPRRSKSVNEGLRSSILADLDESLSLSKTEFKTGEKGKTLQSRSFHRLRTAQKKSAADLRRHFGKVGGDELNSSGFATASTIWNRFPSHTREGRNGSAGPADGVNPRDFTPGTSGRNDQNRAGPQPDSLSRISFMRHMTLNRSKTKSMMLKKSSPWLQADKARKSRTGILGRWKRMQRSSSAEFRKYAYYHGHRSSISLGDAVKYPELECLPGEGIFTESYLNHTHVCPLVRESDDAQRATNEPAANVDRLTEIAAPQTNEWASYYARCVGSPSALNSEADLDAFSDRGPASIDVRSLDIRDSTVNFQEALGREQERIKQDLLAKLDGFEGAAEGQASNKGPDKKRESVRTNATTDTVGASSVRTKDLKIPGRFG